MIAGQQAETVPNQTPLPPLLVTGRLDRLRSALVEQKADAFVASSSSSVRWLTGFTGSAGFAVVTPNELVLITDARYGEQAPEELDRSASPGRAVITSHEQGAAAAAALSGCSTVALEADHMSWAHATKVRDEWLADGPSVVPTSGLVTALRSIKDAAEIARIALAAELTDRALCATREHLRAGVTETAFAHLLDAEIRALGADDVAFDTIVASGPNGARPHHRPSSRSFELGDLVIVDVGAKVDGYRSDMTRTFGIGPVDAERVEMYQVVIEAQQAGVAAVQGDIEARSIDTACREVISAAGRADQFVHGTGHGVGLDIHELPRIGSTATDQILTNQVITVEPGVYVADLGGVRIEDCVHVTANAGVRLTRSPKSLDPEALVPA